jgi:hypothetical protein
VVRVERADSGRERFQVAGAEGADDPGAEGFGQGERGGMTWNMLGMITGQATVTVTACFTRQQS